MDNPKILSTVEAKYNYYELPQGGNLTRSTLEEWEILLRPLANQSKKCLLCLPPYFTLEKAPWEEFVDFLKESLHGQFLFVSQEGVKWGDGWLAILQANLPMAEKAKGIAWATQTEVPAGSIAFQDFNKQIRYVKFHGLAAQALQQFPKILEQAVTGFDMRTKPVAKPVVLATQPFTTWTFFTNAVVFDLASLQVLDSRFFKLFANLLKKHKLKPDSPGLYFATASYFESWMARSSMGEFREVSHIMRVISEHANPDAVISEVESLHRQCKNLRPMPFIFTHEVVGMENATQLLKQFSPDILVADEISDANNLRTYVGPALQDHIYHITPANDPGLRLLQPQLITKGYDIELFGEYLLSRYNNLHGSPNETYFYYLDAQPVSLKKGSNFFLMEFAEILSEEYQKTIQKVAECETKPNSQGSFMISVLQQKILKLDLRLPFTNQGGAQFLNNYKDLFTPHCQILCEPLRLFLKGDRDLPTTAVLHLSDDYNEFFIRQQGFEIEARFQPEKSVLTVKAAPSENLERRCFTLFALLNASDVFSHLPDKEILIEIISLMWKNYLAAKNQTGQGFLITLTATATSSRMKIYQSDNNRIFLEALEENGQTRVTFLANIPFFKDSQKHLLKIVSLFYAAKTPQENNWRFACFESMTQVVANTIAEQKLTLEFGLQGDTHRAIIISSAKDFNMIPARSKTIIEAGADRNQISQDCRQVSLIKNPGPNDKEIGQLSTSLQKELDSLQEKAILQEVEDEKEKEAQARSLKFQKIYGQALKSYNQKYGFAEDDTSFLDQSGGKTVEQALSTHVMRGKEQTANTKIRRGVYLTLGSIVAVICLVILIVMNMPGTPSRGGLIMRDADSEIDANRNRKTAPGDQEPAPSVPDEPTTPKVVLPPYASFNLTNAVCCLINSEAAPSQEQLNSMLKKLVLAEAKYQDADVQNLIGRLYLYKIHLDKDENLFKPEWINRWRQQAKVAFAAAKEKYEKTPGQSNLKIYMTEWKPERGWYPETDKMIVYDSPGSAANDMQLLLTNMK